MDLKQFSHLVESNNIPSQSESMEIHHIAAREEEIQLTLAKSMTTLRKKLEELRQQRYESRLRLRTCRGITSVVRRLPPDVLSEIFVRCLPAHNGSNPIDVSGLSLRNLLLVSHVCSRWRHVAISTAQLWTSVWLKVSDGLNVSRFFDPLEMLWERTYTMPLSLSLQCSEYTLQPLFVDAQLILPSQSEHIETLSLHLPISLISPVLQRSKLTRLETLVIDCHTEEFTWEPITLFGQCTQLRHFTFNTDYVLSLSVQDKLCLPWSQLTSLSVTNGGAWSSTIFYIMKACINLIACYFQIDDEEYDFTDDISDFDRRQPVVLPALRRLEFTGVPYRPEFFGFYKFPALEELKWEKSNEEWRDWSAFSVFGSLQEQSQFDLKVLVLAAPVNLSAAELLDLVRASPSIVRIEIGIHMGHSLVLILESLEYNPSRSDNLAPNLEHFVSYAPFPPCDDDAEQEHREVMVQRAAEVVRSRRQPHQPAVTRLKTLDLGVGLRPILRELIQDWCDDDFSFHMLE